MDFCSKLDAAIDECSAWKSASICIIPPYLTKEIQKRNHQKSNTTDARNIEDLLTPSFQFSEVPDYARSLPTLNLLDAKENMESPETKAAYQRLLEKGKSADQLDVAEGLQLLAELAGGKQTKDTKTSGGRVEPRVAGTVQKEYESLLQRGLRSELVVDILNVAGDLGAIAASPEGKKLVQDLRILVKHLSGRSA